MSKLKVPAALLVLVAMSLGVPAIAAPVSPLSASAKQMAQQTDLVPARYGGWHGGWGGRGFPAGALAGALIGGALIGGAIAAPYYGGSYAYYGDDYGYPAPAYVYPATPPGYTPSFPNYFEYRRCHPYCGWGG